VTFNWKETAMASTVDLGKLKIDDFSPHLDAAFEIQTPDGAVPLKLVAATANGMTVPDGITGPKGQEIKPRGAEGFSLQFVAPQGRWLPQKIYPVKHPKLGTLEIFLVPNGPLHDGHGYHAVFT
jgi:hypothetical protein